jgi:hypothetical protein
VCEDPEIQTQSKIKIFSTILSEDVSWNGDYFNLNIKIWDLSQLWIQ